MKKNLTISFKFIKKYAALIVLVVAASLYLFSQPQGLKQDGDRDVIPGYQGWDGDPDTVTVHIDTTFTEAEKDSVRTAINRWNEAGCVPALKEVTSTPADIGITQSATLPDTVAGLCTNYINGSGDVTSSTIQINDDTSPLSLKEVVTHELGHAIGLDDTDEAGNPSDVMKGTGPTNGTDGGLSAHDSTELAAAGVAALAVEEVDNKAVSPPMAIVPGAFETLKFDLGTSFPPDVIEQTIIMVAPIGDPFLFVEMAYIEDNLLNVGVFSDPTHGSGKIYLMVDLLFPEPYPVMHFRGIHYINILPAEPVTFECPITFNEDDGMVHINWVADCTYPLGHPLRSVLMVDGTSCYYQRGGGDYVLNLDPGLHVIDLYVDDYQINSAYNSLDILVTGIPEKDANTDYKVFPNPFSEVCHIECPEKSHISIYDISGNLVREPGQGNKQWKPSPGLPEGIYFIRIENNSRTKTFKVVYRK